MPKTQRKPRTVYRVRELTSRRKAKEIPGVLHELEVSYPTDEEANTQPLDTVLATNMISVGVDVDRLGLMVVAGQPKTTAEYIQATSRVGRTARSPGLVVTLYNPIKPRDRSHFEQFHAYHAAFNRFVEPTSVTPFAPPVLERAAHAQLVIVARHLAGWKSPKEFDGSHQSINDLLDFLDDRVNQLDQEHAERMKTRLNEFREHWHKHEFQDWGGWHAVQDKRRLLIPSGRDPDPDWEQEAEPTPSSLRNVDVECGARVISRYPD